MAKQNIRKLESAACTHLAENGLVKIQSLKIEARAMLNTRERSTSDIIADLRTRRKLNAALGLGESSVALIRALREEE